MKRKGQPYKDGMPMIGLGTWENTEEKTCRRSVKQALDTGYRHIDTAQIYQNESEVGDGIEMSDTPREKVFLATKIWIDSLSYESVLSTFEESLDRLGTEYIDLLYVHWPSRTYDSEETVNAFNELYNDGQIKNIGISNFEPRQVSEVVKYSDAPIYANQIEVHPLLPQTDLVEVCRQNDVNVVAYSPLARGEVFGNSTISDISNRYNASEAQVALAWLRQREITAIPKASTEDHIIDNWEGLELNLDDEDMRKINQISERDRRVDPSFAPW